MEINDAGGAVDSTGVCVFSNCYGSAGTMTLQYDAETPVDLTFGGENAIKFWFLSADQPATLTVYVTDDDSGTDSVVKSVAIGYGYGLDVLFSDFSGVDFTKVTDVTITLTPDNTYGGDYCFDLEPPYGPAVPEPAGLGLIGIALLALRKRRS